MARDISSRGRRGRATVPASFLARVVVLASVAVIGSVWALVRFYTHPHAPIVVAVPASTGDSGASEWDAGEGLVPVDLEQR